MAVFHFPSQRGNAEDARRRRVGIQGNFVKTAVREDAQQPTLDQKRQLISYHISTINALLRAKGKPELTSGDFARIQSAAEGATSANSESIMQAVLSAATIALPNDAQTSFKQQLADKGIDEAAYYNAIAKFGASLGSFDAIVAAARGLKDGNMSGSGFDAGANYSGVAVANFSSSNGVLSGMTPQLYREHFQAYYGASPQGQFTATRVANVLANNEGLSGAALVRRTKEVGHDTRDRLGLDTNVYAPKIANIGKKYSEPMVTYKQMLDKAIELQQEGRAAEAAELSRRAEEHRRSEVERAKTEDPGKAPDVSSSYGGVTTNALKKGWKPADISASWRSLVDSEAPDARAKWAELDKALRTTPEGRDAAEKFKPIAEKALQAAEERKKAEAASGVKIASEADVFDAPTTKEPAKEPTKEPIVKAEKEVPKAAQPVQEAAKKEDAKKATATVVAQKDAPKPTSPKLA